MRLVGYLYEEPTDTTRCLNAQEHSLNDDILISPTLTRKVNLNTLNFCNERNLSAVLTNPDKQEVGGGEDIKENQ
jgi:hypothetical protein